MRALIVDDEPLARREMARLLSAFSAVTVVQHADSLPAAIDALRDQPPDVVFLDIRLGRESGFQVIPAIPPATALVFVTAYDEYAIRAFDVHALDYLLKPVDAERLQQTIERISAIGQTRMQTELSTGSVSLPALRPDFTVKDWLLLRVGAQNEFVRLANVTCVLAEGDYTRLVLVDGRSSLLHRSLNDWEERLPKTTFARVHRSCMRARRRMIVCGSRYRMSLHRSS